MPVTVRRHPPGQVKVGSTVTITVKGDEGAPGHSHDIEITWLVKADGISRQRSAGVVIPVLIPQVLPDVVVIQSAIWRFGGDDAALGIPLGNGTHTAIVQVQAQRVPNIAVLMGTVNGVPFQAEVPINPAPPLIEVQLPPLESQ